LVLAPRVLLRKDGLDLRRKLFALSTDPQFLRACYFNFANEEQQPERPTAPAADPASTSWQVVEKLAMQSASRAIKKISAATPIPPSDPLAAAHIGSKLSGDPPTLSLEHAKLPVWANAQAVAAVVARDLSRLAAPGPDGWTRELLLGSFDAGTSAAFEGVVNAIMRGSPAGEVAMILRAAHVAMWGKASGGARVIGMTSVFTKTAWKLAAAWHRRSHRMPANAACQSGGVFPVVRRVDRHLASGQAVFVVDKVDAFWRVNRSRVMTSLVDCHSPMAHIFAFVYGQPNPLVHGDVVYWQNDGVLPGCGGAALMFMVDLDVQLSALPPQLRADVDPYMDDLTCFSPQAFRVVVSTLGASQLAKARVIQPAAAPQPQGLPMPMEVVSAAKHLGAFVGEPSAAEALTAARVAEARAMLATILGAPVSCQARWRMLRSVLLSFQWLAMATRPDIFLTCAAALDAAVYDAVCGTFLPLDAAPTHLTALLLAIPMAAGGVGVPQLELDGASLHAIATTAGDDPDEPAPRRVRREMNRVLCDRAIRSSDLPAAFFRARCDDTIPWFEVAQMSRHTRIGDDAWRLGFANFVAADVAYPVCTAYDAGVENTRDHSNCCHTCSGPFRHQRHQRLTQEFISTASKYGVIATANFKGVYGISKTSKKQPDIIVHRSAVAQKTLVLDVAVSHQAQKHNYNALTLMHNYKLRKYADFDEHSVIAPLVMSTAATFDGRTAVMLDGLGVLAVKRGFVRELVCRMKTAVITFEHYRYKALWSKKLNGHLVAASGSAPGAEDDEDSVLREHAGAVED
jgi:hypothetical protein